MANACDIDLIIFDLDNTLFDYAAAFKRVIKKISVPFSIHYSENDWVEIVDRNRIGYSERLAFFDWLSQTYNFPATGQQIWETFRNSFGACVIVNQNTKAMLTQCRRHFKIALLTNGSSKNQSLKIKHSGLGDHFLPTEIFISGELGLEKPDPDIFRLVCDRMDASTQRTLSVGDHLDNDILAAKLATLKTCWLAPLGKGKEDYDYRIYYIEELHNIFRY